MTRTDQAQLRALLSIPGHPDVVLLVNQKPDTITALRALRLLDTGEYQYRRRKRRVSHIELVVPHWLRCYRTTEAPALQPPIGYGRSCFA